VGAVGGRGSADFVIVGAGIVGLALARELKSRHPAARIVVLEKEAAVGEHASGRNSGVLHSGVYYAAGSLKGALCAQGARELAAYCTEHRLPIARAGKVVVPTCAAEDAVLDMLRDRARHNGARAELVDAHQLNELEPDARSATGRALHVPDTAVVDPKAMLRHLARALAAAGVDIVLGQRVEEIDPGRGWLRAGGPGGAGGLEVHYGHLFNAAGLQADRVARACGAGERYAMLPFKGLYYRLLPESGMRIGGLIYPVPDLQVPFLGVHVTKEIDGTVLVGPTAVPALGREHYRGVQGIHAVEAVGILLRLGELYARDAQGFRRFAHTEALRFLKTRFVVAARALLPRLRPEHLTRSPKVGIRAQLLDRIAHRLVMDFVVEPGERSTHVLNAVSPAFTSAFPFARLVLDQAGVSGGRQACA
jgi:L-2-hydroxyglutarate oxidase LhgO